MRACDARMPPVAGSMSHGTHSFRGTEMTRGFRYVPNTRSQIGEVTPWFVRGST